MGARQWTPGQRARLLELKARGDSWSAIARALGRSVQACKQRYALRDRQLAARYWTPAEVEIVEEGVAEGKTAAQLAKKLGRSTTSVEVWMKRHVKRRQLRPLSATAVARMLGIPCSKTVAYWQDSGWLRGRRGPLRTANGKRRQFTEEAVFAFLEDPAHWHRWDPARIPDLATREWATELRRGERFLTLTEVARRYFVEPKTVNQWINRGVLPAVRNGNHLIAESALEGFVPPSMRDRHGRPTRRFTGEEDLVIVSMRAAGATWQQIAERLGRNFGSVVGRHDRLQQRANSEMAGAREAA